ncbi:hypothetical protein CBL_03581 [Carabus blaptoides fortunei]
MGEDGRSVKLLTVSEDANQTNCQWSCEIEPQAVTAVSPSVSGQCRRSKTPVTRGNKRSCGRNSGKTRSQRRRINYTRTSLEGCWSNGDYMKCSTHVHRWV